MDISRVQDSEVGDGTTSVVVLTSELLRQAEILVARKLHPQTIISGWRKGLEVARQALFQAAKECTEVNHPNVYHSSCDKFRLPKFRLKF